MTKVDKILELAKELLDDDQLALLKQRASGITERSAVAYKVVSSHIMKDLKVKDIESIIELTMVLGNVATHLIDKIGEVGELVKGDDKLTFHQSTAFHLDFLDETLSKAKKVNNRLLV